MTRLECTEGTSSKFWEIDVSGSSTTVTFGKIGAAGRAQSKTHANAAAAKKFAESQIKSKLKSGYVAASSGKKRSAADKEEEEEEDEEEDDDEPAAKSRSKKAKPAKAAKSKKPIAPMVAEMRFGSNSGSLGLFADAKTVVAGDQDGVVLDCTHTASEIKLVRKIQLPAGVKAVVKDGDFLYAGTEEGELFDLTNKAPRSMAKIEDFSDIMWIDVYDGCIAVSDSEGNLAFVNGEGEIIWRVDGSAWKGDTPDDGWMCRADATGVYHGHSCGVAKYSLDKGKQLWRNTDIADVMFGVQTADFVFATGGDKTIKINKKTGKTVQTYDASGPSCAVDADDQVLVVCDTAFNAKTGKQLWKFGNSDDDDDDDDDGDDDDDSDDNDDETELPLNGLSAALVGATKLFTVSNNLCMIDISQAAIKKGLAGTAMKTKIASAAEATAVQVSETAEVTTDRTNGIEVECVKEGSKLRIRVVTPGFKKDWNVQFPRALRVAGAHYMCDGIVESAAGSFYRATGDVRKLK